MKNAGFILEDLVAHDAWVRALARRLAADEHTAEDVAQNAWVAALERPPRKRSAVRAWLGRVARNLVFMENRTLARRQLREMRAARSERLPSVEELAERESTRLEVVKAVFSLEEPYRSAILYRYYENLPPREIAGRLGVSVSAVEGRLKRGLRQLQARLEGPAGGGRRGLSAALLPLLYPLTGRFPSMASSPSTSLSGALAMEFKCKIIVWCLSAALHGVLFLAVSDVFITAVPEKTAVSRLLAVTSLNEEERLEDFEEETVEEEAPDLDFTLEPVEEPDPMASEVRKPDQLVPEDPELNMGPCGGSRKGSGGRPSVLVPAHDPGAWYQEISSHLAGVRRRGLEVCIVLDATSSMKGILGRVKSHIRRMNVCLGAFVPGTYRLAMVAYRDRRGRAVHGKVDFTAGHSKVLSFLERLKASGGGDLAENVFAGLETAVEGLKWRKRSVKVIFLIADAPPHEKELTQCLELAERFRQSGTLHTVYAYDSTDEYAMYSASGKTIDVLKSLADRGGGSFVFLDEQSCDTLVLEGMQVPLFGKRIGEVPGGSDPARQGDWRCRYIRKKLHERDMAWLVRTFVNGCPPRVVETLVETDDPWIRGVLRKLAANPHLPGRVRSAAEYVLIRKSFRKR